MSEVWIAGKDDLDQLVTWAEKFHYQSIWAGHEFSPAGARRLLVTYMKNPDDVIFINQTGAIGARIEKLAQCDVTVVREGFWYGGGFSVLSAYMKWCEDKGVDGDLLSSIELQGNDTDRLIDVLKKRYGYKVLERTLYRKLI